MTKKQKQRKPKGQLINPKRVEGWLAEAAEQLAMEDYERLIRTCRRIIRYTPRQAMPRAQALDHLSIAYLMRQQFDQAYEALSEALTITPDQPHLWFNRGLASLYTMRYGQSVRDLERALALETDEALRVDYRRVLADSRQMAEYERSQRGEDFTLDQLIEQEDLYQQGVQLMAAGHWPAAAQMFRQVIARGDCLPQPWGNLGSCLLMQGDFDACERALKRALEIDPDYDLARANLKVLAQVRQTGMMPELKMTHPFDERKPKLSVKFVRK